MKFVFILETFRIFFRNTVKIMLIKQKGGSSMADLKLAKKIIDLREQSDMSQAELARRMNIDKSSMNKIENGSRKVSSEELLAFSTIFDVTTDYLLGKSETKSTEPNDNAMLIAAHIEDDATEEDMAKILDYIEMVKKSKNK